MSKLTLEQQELNARLLAQQRIDVLLKMLAAVLVKDGVIRPEAPVDAIALIEAAEAYVDDAK